MTLTEIETKTKHFADARANLSSLVDELNQALDAVKRPFLPQLKIAVRRAAQRYAELEAAIASAPEAFEKPRTHVFHGVKVGFRKGTGGIDWLDDEKVADLIQKHLPEQFDVLVKTTRKPQAKALASLDVADLKKIGCTVESTGDVVVIKPADSEVDKVVTALLKGATEEAQREAE